MPIATGGCLNLTIGRAPALIGGIAIVADFAPFNPAIAAGDFKASVLKRCIRRCPHCAPNLPGPFFRATEGLEGIIPGSDVADWCTHIAGVKDGVGSEAVWDGGLELDIASPTP